LYRYILDFIAENLRIRSPSDMPYREGTAEEQQERHERMLAVSVAALGGFAKEALAAKEAEAVSGAGAAGGAGAGAGAESSLSDKAEGKLGEVLDGANCLATFVKSPAPALRRAAYTALLAVASGARGDATLGPAGGARRKKIAGLALVTPLTEKDSSNFRKVGLHKFNNSIDPELEIAWFQPLKPEM
jgi:hypothetical protein